MVSMAKVFLRKTSHLIYHLGHLHCSNFCHHLSGNRFLLNFSDGDFEHIKFLSYNTVLHLLSLLIIVNVSFYDAAAVASSRI